MYDIHIYECEFFLSLKTRNKYCGDIIQIAEPLMIILILEDIPLEPFTPDLLKDDNTFRKDLNYFKSKYYTKPPPPSNDLENVSRLIYYVISF